MRNLTQKVQETTLFSEEEKVKILAELPNMNEDQQDELEEILDDYMETSLAILKQYNEEITPHLDALAQEDPAQANDIAQVKTGMSQIIAGVDEYINQDSD